MGWRIRDRATFEALRRHVEAEMNRVHARAYALVGRADRAALYRDPAPEADPVGDAA